MQKPATNKYAITRIQQNKLLLLIKVWDLQMSLRLLMPLLLIVFTMSPCFSQEEKWIPKTDPGYVVDFSQICFAVAGSNKKSIRIAVPTYKSEQRTRTVSKVSMKSETRTRRDNGKDVSYTVEVPVSITEEQTYIVRMPVGFYRMQIPINEIKAWDLQGNLIEPTTLATKLVKATHVIASENDPLVEVRAVDPFFASILRPETLRLHLPPGASSKYAEEVTMEKPTP